MQDVLDAKAATQCIRKAPLLPKDLARYGVYERTNKCMTSSDGPTDKSRLELLKDLERDFDGLSIDEIRARLSLIFKGMWVITPIFNPGTFVYRARRVDATFNTSFPMTLADLKYPPAAHVRLGRANHEGSPMFYCAASKEPVFFEIGLLEVGDEMILSSWKTKVLMTVNNIGYTQPVFDEF